MFYFIFCFCHQAVHFGQALSLSATAATLGWKNKGPKLLGIMVTIPRSRAGIALSIQQKQEQEHQPVLASTAGARPFTISAQRQSWRLRTQTPQN